VRLCQKSPADSHPLIPRLPTRSDVLIERQRTRYSQLQLRPACAEALREMATTVEEKQKTLRERGAAQKALSAAVDRKATGIEFRRVSSGCFAAAWNWILRTFSKKEAATVATSEVQPVPAAKPRFFAKKDPGNQLRQAAQTLESRIESLESRAMAGKNEARTLMESGKKQAALRALRKAKTVEKQIEGNQASLIAVEQQLDAIDQASIQKTLASALQSSSAGMKSSKRILKTAETAIENAQEMRDFADDLQQTMSDFTARDDDDDDALLAELDEIISAASNVKSEELQPQQQEALQLAERHARWDEAERVRAAFPPAPRGPMEKQTLLVEAAV
jgi:hypothetical protein